MGPGVLDPTIRKFLEFFMNLCVSYRLFTIATFGSLEVRDDTSENGRIFGVLFYLTLFRDGSRTPGFQLRKIC